MDIDTTGGLHVNAAFRDLLRENGLDDFESFMQYPDVEIVKQAVKERSTAKVILRDGPAQSTFFLKRHTSPPLKERLKLLTRFSTPKSALNEWRAILRFHELGLPTMMPVAAGKRSRRLGMVTESFLLSREIEGTRRLDHYFAEWQGRRLSRKQIIRKRELISHLAQLTRKMHRSGLNHRDLYLCHILIRERNRGDDFELFIVDLHRVDIRKEVGKRWVIKDLAALNYSSLGLPVQTRDRLRFLKRYLQKTRLEKSDLQLAQQILNKTARIARHTKRMKRRSENQ